MNLKITPDPMGPIPRRIIPRRKGSSLLEVMAATVCASILLVPSASILSDAVRWSSRMEDQAELVTLASNCAEQIQFDLMSNFKSSNSNGSFANQGFPNIRFSATTSDSNADQGIPSKWMIIHLTVWKDENNNGAVDPNEAQHQLTTGVARRS